jgi:hypothetical protein
MALLNKRQQTAAALSRAITDMRGCWVDSPLPLDDGQKLRVQVLDTERIWFLQAVRDLGYEPVFVTIKPRVDFTGFIGASLFEVDIPRERQPIHDDRTITGEIAKPEKSNYERDSILKYLGIQK